MRPPTATGKGTQSARSRALWALGALAGLYLADTTIGLPGILMLGGTWLLGCAVGQAVPKLRGTAAWAAALLIEVAALDGASACAAVVSPRPQSRTSDLAVLVVPFLIAGALWLVSRHRRAVLQAPLRFPAAVAAVVTISGLAVVRGVASVERDYGVAWAMSGDSRNETLITRSIIQAGGLTVHELKSYPAVVNTLIALISGAGGRTGLAPGDLMLHDAQAAATVFALAWIAVALTFIAALMELPPMAASLSEDEPTLNVLVVLVAVVMTSASSLVLGTAIAGGFYDGYATIALVTGAVVLALRCCREPSPAALALTGLATPLVFFSWSILAFVPAVLVVLLLVLTVAQRQGNRSAFGRPHVWLTAAAIASACVLLTAGAVISQRKVLEAQFVVFGSFTPTQPKVLVAICLLAAGTAFVAKDRTLGSQMLLVVCVALACAAVLRWLTTLPGSQGTWTYYAYKTLWLTTSSFMWVPFVPALIDAIHQERAPRPDKTHRRLGAGLRAACWCGVVLMLVGVGTTAPSPWAMVRSGWIQPTAPTVADVVVAANTYHRFLFWQDAEADDGLADFWAALVWDSTAAGEPIPLRPGLPEGLAKWAYSEGGRLADLCTVVKAVPDLVVITSDVSLKAQLEMACPSASPRLVDSGTLG